MTKNFVSNAFALSMVGDCQIRVRGLTIEEAVREVVGRESVIGHADTAGLFSNQLGCDLVCNRVSITLDPGDSILVGQFIGPRLPEGVRTLPEGARIEWKLVEIF